MVGVLLGSRSRCQSHAQFEGVNQFQGFQTPSSIRKPTMLSAMMRLFGLLISTLPSPVVVQTVPCASIAGPRRPHRPPLRPKLALTTGFGFGSVRLTETMPVLTGL